MQDSLPVGCVQVLTLGDHQGLIKSRLSMFQSLSVTQENELAQPPYQTIGRTNETM